MPQKNILLITILIFYIFSSINASAQEAVLTEPFPNITVPSIIGMETPLDDGWMYLVSQEGLIYRIDTNVNQPQRETWLNISARLISGGERGLLGLAFHPEFEENGYFYVNYTASNPARTVISRFQTNESGMGDADSELVLLEYNQPFSNHNGGHIAFGPDGFLYIASGDGGSGGDPQGNGQNTQTLLGALLRIDVDNPDDGLNYGVPEDNVFAGSNAGRDEIFAWGLRNPWRFSFDKETGDLWTGDVGQNAWESIYIIENGLNYGWNILEGSNCFSPSVNCNTTGLEFPVFEYNHSNGDRSITGGFVYRGVENPNWNGKYIYGDFVSGRIWALDYDMETESVITNQELINAPFNISSFGQDLDGEIYVLSYGTGRLFYLNRDTTSLEPETEKPSLFNLKPAYPNPFNPTTNIQFELRQSGQVQIDVFSVSGQNIMQLANKNYSAGNHTATFDANGLASGIYIIRAQWNNTAQYQRVTLVK